MKKFVAFTLILAAVAMAPALAAQAAASFTGKWEGTFKMQRPDGTEGEGKATVFNLTQTGKALAGTAGPPDQQWKIEKGVVVQQPGGPLFHFTLTIVKGRLTGEMAGEVDGVVRGHANVDAAKVPAKGK
jgi:hypothetical protein